MSTKGFTDVFSKNLDKFMVVYEMNQSDLARRLGVSQTSVSNWLNGYKIPRMDKIDALCSLFRCSREALITDPDAVRSGIYTELIRKVQQLDFDDASEIEAIIDLKLSKEKYKKIDAV